MPNPQTILLLDTDQQIALTGGSVGVLLPIDEEKDSSTSASPPSTSFTVPLNQRPLIRLVTLSELSLAQLPNGEAPVTETENSSKAEALSVDQARELIKELEAGWE